MTSILRHFRCMTSEDGWCIVDFAKFAFRLGETPILWFLVPTCGLSSPSWRRLLAVLRPSSGRLEAILGPSWLIMGPLRATLGGLVTSRGEDRQRHRRFSRIRTPPTREHHCLAALSPFVVCTSPPIRPCLHPCCSSFWIVRSPALAWRGSGLVCGSGGRDGREPGDLMLNA